MPRHKLSDAVVETYLRRISTGELAPGAPLPAEAALSAQFGVGRSVAREALRGLAAKGFVELRQGATTVVADRSRWQMLDRDFIAATGDEGTADHALEAIQILKPRLAALAAARADERDLAALKALIDQFAAADSGERPPLAVAFDEALARAAHNPVLAGLWNTLVGLVGPNNVTDDQWMKMTLEAIHRRDADKASAAARLSSSAG